MTSRNELPETAQCYRGQAFVCGDDVNTDDIIPARYLSTNDPDELASHLFENFGQGRQDSLGPGAIIVAGRNFGCGSSREHAPVAIKARGISCVIARSFARIFYRNAINVGLAIFEAPDAVPGIQDGDQVEVDPARGTVNNVRTGELFEATPYPPFLQEIMAAGGLIPYGRRRLGGEDE